MKKNGSGKRVSVTGGKREGDTGGHTVKPRVFGPAPPEKFGWIRRFCGRGIFREIWKNRFVVLRADQLFICEKEVPNLMFLAVSPEEKESWIQVLNAAITRAKNRILDETRRLPTRGHLLAVASSSDGALTLDLIQEDDPSRTPPPPLFLRRGFWEIS
ncbi:Pleckstrin like domain containing family O member 1 [Dissostichus eleginoides]|uniref:Pleckstrin like domain containing family O member 1 n=1 Tax=Dissostichus eleginoides TaxID=100907 RepID=A0AAD9C6D7_DISEL|nr:Pleckstrin like domain containing family O member 1 [Dissostichus eleginoides]